MASSQTAWLTRVSVLVGAVMLSGLKIHVLTKAGSVNLMKSGLAPSEKLNRKFRTKTKKLLGLMSVSVRLFVCGVLTVSKVLTLYP